MKKSIALGLATLAALGIAGVTAPAASAASPAHHSYAPVFVQTDGLSGNRIVAYSRNSVGDLSELNSYSTHGLGGQLTGSVVDHLASQHSLVYRSGLLYAVNAGSNSISVFRVHGSKLKLLQVIGSGGSFPVSIAVKGKLVEVLNARNGGIVQGFLRAGSHLVRVQSWSRALGLNASQTPEFTSTPGDIAFTPSGSKVIVTTKGNGSAIDVFSVSSHGTLASSPIVNTEAGAVPFALSFDAHANLVVAEAGTNSVATYTVNHDGTVTPIDQQATGQSATCWIVRSGSNFYASNAGSGSITAYRDGGSGTLTSLGNTVTDGGTVDAAVSHDARNIYVQTGATGTVDEYRVSSAGALTRVGSVVVPGAVGGEGIVAL